MLADGEAEAAIEKYEEAIGENERTALAWLGWGQALSRLRRHEQALEKFERAARGDPLHRAIFHAWADALDVLGRVGEATAKRREAVDVERDNAGGTAAVAARRIVLGAPARALR